MNECIAHCRATRSLIEAMSTRPAQKETISASHANKLCIALIPKVTTDLELGDLCKLVADVGFLQADEEQCIGAIAQQCEAIATVSAVMAGPRGKQEWDFREHLPLQLWEALPSDNGHMELLRCLEC